jgi:hypothetical protein
VAKTTPSSAAARPAVQSSAGILGPKIPSQKNAAEDRAPNAAKSTNPSQYLNSLVPARTEKAQVFLSAPLPALGVSTVYETLCRQYQPQKALQMVLRRALQEYEAMLEDGSFLMAPEFYAVDQGAGLDDFVQTSRMMPKGLTGIARAHFDPLGLESTRSFGRKLAISALASFFAREPSRR